MRKLIALFGVLAALAVLITACSKKGTNNDDDDTPLPGPALIIVVNHGVWPDPPDSLANAAVEIYQNPGDWNLDEEPVYAGVTDSNGFLVIFNDTLINRGISDKADLYIYAHSDSLGLANWDNARHDGKLFFDARDSVEKEIGLQSGDYLYQLLNIPKWNLVDVKVETTSIWDLDSCFHDNYLTITKGYTSNFYKQRLNIYEGANICGGNDPMDSLYTQQEIAGNDGGRMTFGMGSYTDHDKYGYDLDAHWGAIDTVNIQFKNTDTLSQTYYTYMKFVKP